MDYVTGTQPFLGLILTVKNKKSIAFIVGKVMPNSGILKVHYRARQVHTELVTDCQLLAPF
jgi:hypothetical protein